MKFSKKFITLASFVVIVLASTAVFAFTGPTTAPGVGGGFLRAGTAGDKLGIGGDPSGQTTYTTIFNPSDLALGIRQGANYPLFFRVGTDGALAIDAKGDGTSELFVRDTGVQVGTIKITGGSPGANKVLTSAADGTASWATPASSGGWTKSGTNVVLTTVTDNVGIGESNPTLGKLVVIGGGFPTTLFAGYGTSSTGGAFMLRQSTSNDYVLDIASGGLAKLTIDNSDAGASGKLNLLLAPTGGTIGIGTASPDTAYILDINGNVKLSGASPAYTIKNVYPPVDSNDVATRDWVLGQVGGSSVADSLTANGGLYNNKIVTFTPPNAYTEVCFKSGSVQADVHTVSEPTTSGSTSNCSPGDIGYIIEKDERTLATWEIARRTCLVNSMRLPEPFEWKLACTNNGGSPNFQLNNMTGSVAEWASNFTLLDNGGNIIAANLGGSVGQCYNAAAGKVGGNSESSLNYRCVR